MLNIRIRNEQVCARCRNHGQSSKLKGHKKTCPFLYCQCEKCIETKERQTFIAREIAFHRRNSKNKSFDDKKKFAEMAIRTINAEFAPSKISGEVRRNQMCARCRNHGIDCPIRGHKNLCPFNNCPCDKCQITKERRKIMAKQIRDYRTNKPTDEIESDYQHTTVNSDDTDSGYNTSPNNSPEANIKHPFPVLTEAPAKEAEFNEKIVTDLAEKVEKTPDTISVISSLPQEMINTFFMVQSLYEKYCLRDSKNKIQFVFAFVLLAHQNWSFVENALTRGMCMIFILSCSARVVEF